MSMSLCSSRPAAPPARPPRPPRFPQAWLPEAAGDDPAPLYRLAAGRPQRFGELVAALPGSRKSLVQRALGLAARSGEKVGEAFVRLGVLTPSQRDAVLEFQRHQRGEAPTEDRLRLGRILVDEGRLSRRQLEDALARQRRTGRPLGEELVASGHITEDVLRGALETQRRLVAGALVAALAMVSPAAMAPAFAAQSASQGVHFMIRIPPLVRLQMVKQAATFLVTEQDVARGYVEVAGGSLLQVTANTPWEVSFQPHGDQIRAARVSGLSGEVTVGPGGGSRANLAAMRQPVAFELSYRFDLAPGVAPGTYPWPLSVSANAA